MAKKLEVIPSVGPGSGGFRWSVEVPGEAEAIFTDESDAHLFAAAGMMREELERLRDRVGPSGWATDGADAALVAARVPETK